MKHGETSFDAKPDGRVRITDANGCFVDVPAKDVGAFVMCDPGVLDDALDEVEIETTSRHGTYCIDLPGADLIEEDMDEVRQRFYASRAKARDRVENFHLELMGKSGNTVDVKTGGVFKVGEKLFTHEQLAKLAEKIERPLEPDEALHVKPGSPFAGAVRSRLTTEEFAALVELAPSVIDGPAR